MSIYSPNRTGKVITEAADGIVFEADMSYGINDIGRVLYESTVNDQRIFEAIVMSDLTEARGLCEGTLLMEEAKKLSKENLVGLKNTVFAALKRFWEKVKGIFKTAIDKVSAYILRDGKKFAKLYREAQKNAKTTDVSVTGVVRDFDFVIDIPATTLFNDMLNDEHAENMTAKEETVKRLATMCGNTSITNAAEFRNEMLKKAFSEKTVTNTDSEKMLEFLEGAAAAVKELRKIERDSEKAIREAMKLVKSEDAADAKVVTIIGTAAQNVISATTSCAISITKKTVSTSRKALGQMMSQMKKESPVIAKEAAAVFEDEVNEGLDCDMPCEPISDDVRKEIDDTVAAADAALDGECGKGC